MEKIPDHLQKHLHILFIGFNPSIRSSETGHQYAGPGNRFWKILELSGLTERRYTPAEDGELLELGYGFTNIVERPTAAASEITKEEYKQGRIRLRQILEQYHPEIACFVGKGVYLEYSRRKKADWGFQPFSAIPGTLDFVAPSSSGLVRMPLDEIAGIYRKLAEYLDVNET